MEAAALAVIGGEPRTAEQRWRSTGIRSGSASVLTGAESTKLTAGRAAATKLSAGRAVNATWWWSWRKAASAGPSDDGRGLDKTGRRRRQLRQLEASCK